jgi:hypothetical protein
MNILGKYYRKNYIDSGLLDLNLNNFPHEFLIISSPHQRSIDSSIAFSMGLFPEKMYKIYDFNNIDSRRESNPPIIKNIEKDFYHDEKEYFNLVIDNKKKNTLFHAKKCKFEDSELNFKKIKNINLLSQEERNLVLDFLKSHFSTTLKDTNLENLEEIVEKPREELSTEEIMKDLIEILSIKKENPTISVINKLAK